MNGLSNKERREISRVTYREGMKQVQTTPPPEGQKYLPGTRVHIAADLGPEMGHFPSDCDATVLHTYAHAFWGDDVDSYCLDVDGAGIIAWYHEHQLSEVRHPGAKERK